MLLYSDYSLKPLNTFNIDAKSEIYFEVSDKQDIDSFIRKRKYFEMPRLIIGNGSNILFTKDYKGVVLKNSLKGIDIQVDADDYVLVRVASGESFDEFAFTCARKRYCGIENLSGIPGSVGGAVVQNIGAYGQEIKNLVEEVEYYDFSTFEFNKIKGEDCKFGYRDSIFKHELSENVLITSVTFRLSKKFEPMLTYGHLDEAVKDIPVLTPMLLRKTILSIRDSKIPDYKQFGNAGSFFKNPELTKAAAKKITEQFPEVKTFDLENGNVKIPAGQLIDLCGFKQDNDEKVGVAENNALIVFNRGNAKGKDVLAFAKKIEKTVKDKFGVKLEPEVVIC